MKYYYGIFLFEYFDFAVIINNDENKNQQQQL